MTHYDTYFERRLAAAEGALGLDSQRRRRVAVGSRGSRVGGAAGVKFESMMLMVDVVVALHPAVKCIVECCGGLMSAIAVSKFTQKLNGGVAPWSSDYFLSTMMVGS